MDEQDPTKARVLEAAGEEFAAKGFAGATVRAICDRAGANLAAVNYHFGGKEALYERAVVEAHRGGVDEPTPDAAALAGEPPEGQLRIFVRHFLEHVFAIGPTGWRHDLMLREMLRPTVASDTLAREVIRPRFERLTAILRALCPGADQRRIDALAFSVVGQCLFYRVCRPIQERLIGLERTARLDADYLTGHITAVMLGAIGRPETPSGGGSGSTSEGGR